MTNDILTTSDARYVQGHDDFAHDADELQRAIDSLRFTSSQTRQGVVYVSGRFFLNHTIRSGGTVDYAPYLHDVVWIAFRGTAGTYTRVTVFDPVNNLTLENGYDLGDDGSEALFGLVGNPSLLTMGANTVTDLTGYGRFACADYTGSILSDAALIARIEALVCA